MIELLSLELVKKNYVTDQIVLDIGYDIENLNNPNIKKMYTGDVIIDNYGRYVPKSVHGTIKIDHKTSSTKIISEYCLKLFEKIANPILLVKRINMAVCNLIDETNLKKQIISEQLDLFTNYEEIDKRKKQVQKEEQNEKTIQKIILDIKDKYGKNAILRGMNLLEGATTKERNEQIGGHRRWKKDT